MKRARVINAGWGGARIADWITTDQPYRAYGSIPAAAPDLSVVCLTINDWNAGTAVATYKAGLGTLVDRCLTTGDVLLMTGCPSDPAQGKASYAAQAALRDAVFEVAATRGLAAPIDGTALFGGSFAAGLMFDSVHPNAAGQARIAEAVRARVKLLQVAGGLVGADEGEHVDLAAGHQRADGLAATPVDDIDHPGREAVAKRLQQRANQQHAELGRLEHHGVAHDQRRDQRGEGLVQRVVVRPHAQGHAQWGATDLAEGALFQLEAAGAAVQVLEGVDGVDDVVAGAVEFLF